MALVSRWFRENARLQNCLVSDAAHVVTGASGDHVALIQQALQVLDDAGIAPDEIAGQSYGSSTAGAVLNFKKKRGIINRAYQSTPDNIVGKMTIRSLDDEILARERQRSRALLAFGISEQPVGAVIAQSHPFPSRWASQVEKAHRDLVRKKPSPRGSSEQALKELQTLIKGAGQGGLLIFAVGHGIAKSDFPASGGFDLAEGAALRIGGKGSSRDPKTFTNVFYDEKPPAGSTIPFSEKELDERTRPAGSAKRLKNFALFERLSQTFRETRPVIVLLTCRIGLSRDFMQKVSNVWQSPILAYDDFIAYEGDVRDNRLLRVRAILDRDKGKFGTARPGTNTTFSETSIPVSIPDMSLFFPR
jgi:peptidoglycan hydrolase-like protein with peptidoglycan-binding domain